MPDQTSHRNDLDQVLARFPDRAETIRRLYLANDGFRSACADHGLALAALSAFEARPDSGSRPEVAEYRQLIRDLESELAALIAAAAG